MGHSEELSVKHSPRKRKPAVFQLPEQGAKGSPFVLRQNSWDVFPENPAGTKLAHSSNKFEHEPTSGIIDSEALSRDGEGLAGASPHNDIWPSSLIDELLPIDERNIAQIRDGREPVL